MSKYGKNVNWPFNLAAKVERGTVGKEPLTDQVSNGIDVLYYGTGIVGTDKPQSITFDFDTGSSDNPVPGPSCGTAQGCVGTTKYDLGGIDQGNTTSVTYGSGMIAGENYFDSLSVAGLKAEHVNIVSLTSAQGFESSDSDGLLGMGFSSIAQSRQPTYFEQLISQKVVKKPEFSLSLGRASSGTSAFSELYLGGRNRKKFTGKPTKVPVTRQAYWQIALDTDLVNDKSALLIDTTKGEAAIDTGTTLIIAPIYATLSIYSRVPGAFPLPVAGTNLLIYAFPCDQTPKVEFVFGGKNFAINPADLSFGNVTAAFANFMGDQSLASKLSSQKYCLGSIVGADIDPSYNLYVVGGTFLKSWYSIYNYKNFKGKPSVSFAKAKAPEVSR